MTSKPVSATIIPADQLALQVRDALKQSETPRGTPAGLENKAVWIECTVRNATQFQIIPQGLPYFDSGKYWSAPGSIAPFGTMTFSGCNKDGSILTGVTGGNSLAVVLDGTTFWKFSLGWTNPWNGGIKAGVAESESAEEGYKAAENGEKIARSTFVYEGKKKEGNGTTKFYFQVSATPGQHSTFDITQILL